MMTIGSERDYFKNQDPHKLLLRKVKKNKPGGNSVRNKKKFAAERNELSYNENISTLDSVIIE